LRVRKDIRIESGDAGLVNRTRMGGPEWSAPTDPVDGAPEWTAAGDLLDVLVADVLAASPWSARVFVDRGMACVGCAFARFETVTEAAVTYGIDALELANALAATARRGEN
jgi:hybrid cluster-associated redox disulfide protein